MGIVIKVEFNSRWNRPVHVGEGDLITDVIASPADALRFMSKGFLFQSGTSYHRARRLCKDATEGKAAPEKARRSFMNAYAEDCVRRCLTASHGADLGEGASS